MCDKYCTLPHKRHLFKLNNRSWLVPFVLAKRILGEKKHLVLSHLKEHCQCIENIK